MAQSSECVRSDRAGPLAERRVGGRLTARGRDSIGSSTRHYSEQPWNDRPISPALVSTAPSQLSAMRTLPGSRTGRLRFCQGAQRPLRRDFGIIEIATVTQGAATADRAAGERLLLARRAARLGRPSYFVLSVLFHRPCETGGGNASWRSMPELPDAAAYVAALEPRVAGRPLERVRLASPFLLRTTTPELPEVEGRVVRAAPDDRRPPALETCPRRPQGPPEPGSFRFPTGIAHGHRGRRQAEGIAPRGGRGARPARNGPGRH